MLAATATLPTAAAAAMATPGDLRYANELVGFIREHSGDHFRIDVGCYPEIHPQAEDAHADLRYFKAKIDAGADAAGRRGFCALPPVPPAADLLPVPRGHQRLLRRAHVAQRPRPAVQARTASP